MDNDDQKTVDALMAAQRKNRKIIPCPECERLQREVDIQKSMWAEAEGENKRLQKLYDVAVADRVRMHEEIKNLQAENKEHIDAYQNVFWENERLRKGKR